jgi:hypothetical protein
VTDPDVSVWLDGVKLEVKSFEKYAELFPGVAGNKAYERPCDGWEIAASIGDGSGLQQVSFVNGVATLRGGRHVDHIVQQICKKVTFSPGVGQRPHPRPKLNQMSWDVSGCSAMQRHAVPCSAMQCHAAGSRGRRPPF